MCLGFSLVLGLRSVIKIVVKGLVLKGLRVGWLLQVSVVCRVPGFSVHQGLLK